MMPYAIIIALCLAIITGLLATIQLFRENGTDNKNNGNGPSMGVGRGVIGRTRANRIKNLYGK